MSVMRSSETNFESNLLFLHRLELLLREKPDLALKDLCLQGLCPVRVLEILRTFRKAG